jgi:NAD(P)H dehydrogenase (quinone)
MSKPTLLVTGAGGQLGRRVVELLLEQHQGPVVAATRDPAKISDLAARGAEVRRADFEDAASLDAAFRGVDRALLVSTDALDRPDRRYEQHLAAIGGMVRAKVKHVLYTSIVHPVRGATSFVAEDHRRTEEALSRSGIGYTALRNNLYADLSVPGYAGAIASGRLVSARGAGKVSLLSREDCARAAAAALTSGFEGTRALDITGPQALGGEEIASILSSLSGKPVAYVPVTAAEAVEGMVARGLPRPLAEAFVTFDVAIARGELAVVSPAFEELTGRKAQGLRQYLGERRAALGI